MMRERERERERPYSRNIQKRGCIAYVVLHGFIKHFNKFQISIAFTISKLDVFIKNSRQRPPLYQRSHHAYQHPHTVLAFIRVHEHRQIPPVQNDLQRVTNHLAVVFNEGLLGAFRVEMQPGDAMVQGPRAVLGVVGVAAVANVDNRFEGEVLQEGVIDL